MKSDIIWSNDLLVNILILLYIFLSPAEIFASLTMQITCNWELPQAELLSRRMCNLSHLILYEYESSLYVLIYIFIFSCLEIFPSTSTMKIEHCRQSTVSGVIHVLSSIFHVKHDLCSGNYRKKLLTKILTLSAASNPTYRPYK